MPKTAGQKLSQQKYNDKTYDRLAILVKKGKRDEYKQAAEERGLKYAEMIRLAIEEFIENHPVKESPARQAEVV